MWRSDPYDEFKAEVRKETPCRYYFRPDNTCKFGDVCNFSHNPSNVKLCRFYKSPNFSCKYGDTCLFRHDRPNHPDTREKYDVQLYKERQQFKFEELRKQYLEEKEETKRKFSIMPFSHGKVPEEWQVLSWEDAIKTLENLRDATVAEIQTIPGYRELFKKDLSSKIHIQSSKLQVCIYKEHKTIIPPPKPPKSIMVVNWQTGEITITEQREQGKDDTGAQKEDKMVVISQNKASGIEAEVKCPDTSENKSENICSAKEDGQKKEMVPPADNKELEDNDRMIATILTEEDVEKKTLASALDSCQDEKKIQADEKEQEKNDLMISILLSEEEKQKKEDQLNQDDTEESKICDDGQEKENGKESAKEDPSVTATSASTPDTPSSIATPRAQIPPNTPTTVEAQKTKARHVSISMKDECIPSRLEKMCTIIKSFYDQLCEELSDRNIMTWDPKQVFTVYNEALSLGLEDFHKYEQSVLLNCIFDHWMPSVSKWAQFLTHLTDEYARDVADPEQKHEESLQALSTELMWWINEKDENPIFVGASFAGLLDLKCSFEDIDYMMDIIVCEIDVKGNAAGGILVGMSKYMELGKFASYVHHYLASIGCVDFSRCACKTFKCICPVEVSWEDGVSVLEPVCEYAAFDKEQEAKFFSIATDSLWDQVLLLMIAEEVFPMKSSQEIYTLLDQSTPIPRTESELADLYDSMDETYMGTSVESTDGSHTGEDDSDFDEGLVEYDLEEMEKGNLSTTAAPSDARFKDPGLGDIADPNNNTPEEPDRHLGVAIDMAVKAATARSKGDRTRKNSNKSDEVRKYSPKKRYRRKTHPYIEDSDVPNRRPSKSPKPQYRSPRSHKDTEKWVRSHSMENEGKAIETMKKTDSRREEGRRDHDENYSRRSPQQKSPSHRRNSGKSGKPRRKSTEDDKVTETDTAPPVSSKSTDIDPQSESKGGDAKSPSPKEQRPPRRRRRSAALKQESNEEVRGTDGQGNEEIPSKAAKGKSETKPSATKASSEGKSETKTEEDSPNLKSPARKRRRSNRRRSNPSNTLNNGEQEERPPPKINEGTSSKKQHPPNDPKIQPTNEDLVEQPSKDNPVEKDKVVKNDVKSPRSRNSGGRNSGKKINSDNNATKDNKPEPNAIAKNPKSNRRSSQQERNLTDVSKPCKTWKGLCRNKGKSTCVQGMCANCCIQTDENCKVHEMAKSQRMTRNLIPACVTGGYGPRAKRVDFNRITPFRYFAKRAEFEKFINTPCEEIIHRICFGPNFGIRDEHVIKACEKFGQSLLVFDLGCSDSGDGVRLTDEAAFAISKYCPKVIKVKLESCTNISNDAALALVESCMDLQCLEISGHDKQKGKLTASVLEPLFNKKFHPSLKTLCLNDQELGEHGIIRRLGRCRPSIKIYNEDTYDYDRYWGDNWRY